MSDSGIFIMAKTKTKSTAGAKVKPKVKPKAKAKAKASKVKPSGKKTNAVTKTTVKKKASKSKTVRKKIPKKSTNTTILTENSDVIPEVTKTTETITDEPPKFIDIDDKNLRNGFGYKLKSRNDVDLELQKINEKLRKQNFNTTYRPIKREQKSMKIHDILAKTIMFTVVIILILLIVLTVYYFISNNDPYVEDGVCQIKTATYAAGEKATEYFEVPDASCHTREDCKQVLLDMSFSLKDIEKMRLKCVEAS